MIPSSDVDIVIVYNEDLLDKVVNILMDIPWVRTVKVWDRNRTESQHIKGSVQVVKAEIDPTVMTQEQARAKLAVLSPREVQVAKLAALKLSSPVIGERLGISERTAEAHMSSAFKKLGLHASGELAELLEIAEI